MCSIFVSTMDNYQGDLTDILRASGTSSSSEPAPPQQQHQHQHHDHWQHHHHHNHHNFSSDPLSFSSVLEDHRGGNYFGDPFSTLRDPFLQELTAGSSSYFNINTSSTTSGGLEQQAGTSLIDGGGVNSNNNNTNSTSAASSSVFALDDPHHPHHHDMRSSSSSSRPCKNIFSNMIQISPNAKLPYDSSTLTPSPRPIKPSAVVSPNISINATNTSKDSLVDNSGVQISSSRNTGLKRRKNQAKKVVCIPAPAAANSRQTGEVVPSDLWAWRKYGQKPIKGSPYPRGYYRCSSSKGCSARKQVERSRTDPNMLVITYTSEHNHPWPTQRNALAGSTRSQPSKTNASLKNSETSQPQKGTTTKAKEEENNNSDGNINSPVAAAVKEEMEDIEKLQQLEMDEGEFSDGIGLPYKPSMMETNQLSHEDFFAELGEIEADPLNLLFTQGFGSAAADDHQKESKALDPFQLFDWSENTNNTTNSFEEPHNKRRL